MTLADATRLGGAGPSRGRLAPFIKTFYFSDEAYPFSGATRDDLLDGYSRDGFEWQGDYQATDVTLSVRGLDDLHGPIVTLEQQLLARPDPDEEEIRAGTVGACLVAVLIHRALRDTIDSQGLPRPLCVIAACDGVYPLFDAPVAGIEAGEADSLEEAEAGDEAGEVAVEGSLLNLISRRTDKAPVMTLCADDVAEELRFEEIAAAQILEATGEHTPAGSLDLSQFDAGEAGDGPDDWTVPGAYEDRPPPAGWAPPMPPARDPDAPPLDFDLALGEWGEEEVWGEDQQAFEPTPDLPEFADPLGDMPEDDARIEEDDPAEPAEPPPPPAGHSLRARIVVTPTEVRPSAHGPFGTIVSRFWRTLMRR